MKTRLWILALTLLPSAALAAPMLSFDNPTLDGGTLAYDGAGGAAVATDVLFQQVIGVNTPLNAGVSLFCNPTCLLDLTTGPNLTEPAALPGAYTFGGGGTLTLVGGLYTQPGGGGVTIVPDGSALVDAGVFDAPALVLAGVNGLGFAGVGVDLTHPDLVAFYGLADTPFRFVNTELSSTHFTVDPRTRAFSGTVTDADLVTVPVPEPATLWLLGTGLIGLGWWRRPR